jgi:hypothetical protein
MTVADTEGPESAVRLYLTFLDDPQSLVDAKAVKKLEALVEKAKDPVDKLKALAALERARTADENTYRTAFINHAKLWADAEGVPATAFQQLHVPSDVLQAAGLLQTPKRGRSRARVSQADLARRRPPVKSERLEEGIVALTEPFTVKDVSEHIGGSAITVKAAIDRLLAQGRIEPAGERRGERGRASKLWTVTGGSSA